MRLRWWVLFLGVGALLVSASAIAATAACVTLASIRSSPCFAAFYGLDDPSIGSAAWASQKAETLANLRDTAEDYPGVTDAAVIPGEQSTGVHIASLKSLSGPTDLYQLVALSFTPSHLAATGNVFAAATQRFQPVLQRKILASNGNLSPADVLRLALDTVKQVSGQTSYPLAVLTAHDLLKQITITGRGAGEDALSFPRPSTLTNTAAVAYNAHIDKEATILCRQSQTVAKLRSLRADPGKPIDDMPGDKMGPWYHAFAILTVGALVGGVDASLAVAAEHGGKATGLFENEGTFDPEKFSLDVAFALTATRISLYFLNPLHGTRQTTRHASTYAAIQVGNTPPPAGDSDKVPQAAPSATRRDVESSGCGTPTPTTTTTPPATPAAPTEFTLTVDGTAVTEVLKTGVYHDSGGIVVNTYYSLPHPFTAGETMSATATANASLPPGWSITIMVPPAGSAPLCKTTAQSCGPATTTFPGGGSWIVDAQLNTPTGYYSAAIIAWANLPSTG